MTLLKSQMWLIAGQDYYNDKDVVNQLGWVFEVKIVS